MAPRDYIINELIKEVLGPREGCHELLPLNQDPRDEYITGVLAPTSAGRPEDDIDGDVDDIGEEANRETGDRMASISMQQGREAAGAAYAAAGTSITGHKTAQSLNDQATRVEFTGRITGAEIMQKAAIDAAKLQAISTILSRMGAKIR